MGILERFKNLGYREIFLLAGIFISHPKYISPTLRATKSTMEICDSFFGSQHHGNNKANAFRHALWNYLLCEKTFAVSKSADKAVEWAKRITDLHEKLSPNPELEKIMDLHNNYVGRNLFLTFAGKKEKIEEILMNKMKFGLQVNSGQEIGLAGENLVFIEK